MASMLWEFQKYFFQKYQDIFLHAEQKENNGMDHYKVKEMITDFFFNLFRNLCNWLSDSKQADLYVNKMKKSYEQYLAKFQSRKQKIKQFLEYFQQRHFQILLKYQKQLIEEPFHFFSYKPLIIEELIIFPGFKYIFFGQNFIFHLIKNGRFKQFAMLWSFSEERLKLIQYKLNDKNILELVCESEDEFHDFIDILWKSKLFQVMPDIKKYHSWVMIHKIMKSMQEQSK